MVAGAASFLGFPVSGLFWAACLAIAGGVLAIIAAKRVALDQSAAAEFAFVAAGLGGVGTAIGFVNLAGESGWRFAVVATVIAGLGYLLARTLAAKANSPDQG